MSSRRKGNVPERVALPPPVYGATTSFHSPKPFHSTSFKPNAPSYQESQPVSSAPPATSSMNESSAPPATSSTNENQVHRLYW